MRVLDRITRNELESVVEEWVAALHSLESNANLLLVASGTHFHAFSNENNPNEFGTLTKTRMFQRKTAMS
jgi:hypothetical protein